MENLQNLGGMYWISGTGLSLRSANGVVLFMGASEKLGVYPLHGHCFKQSMINHVDPNPHGFLILYVISCDIRPIHWRALKNGCVHEMTMESENWPMQTCSHQDLSTVHPLSIGRRFHLKTTKIGVKRGCQVGREPKWLKLHQSPNFRAQKLPSTSVSMDLARDPGSAPSWSHCRIPRYHRYCVFIYAHVLLWLII